MTDILSSNGDDLSSNPSTQSEYYSVTSSLDVLASTEEVYHSFDDNVNNCLIKNSQQFISSTKEIRRIFKQNKMDIDPDENRCKLSTSIETIPESMTCRNSLECEFWDKYLHPLRVVKSQNSLNSFENDCNNSITFSNSYHKNQSSITEDYNNNEISDKEQSNSCSINITTQLNSSQIDGELSDINEIIYESKVSPVDDNENGLISDENRSSEIDNEIITDELTELKIPDNINQKKTPLIPEKESQPIRIKQELLDDNLRIYEMVKQLESSQLQSSIIDNNKNDDHHHQSIKIMENNNNNNILLIDEAENKKPSPEENCKILIENSEESPIKRTYLCCSIRKNKKKTENKNSRKIHNFKAIKLFSFFKKSTKPEKLSINKELFTEQCSPQCRNVPVLFKLNSIDYDAIPYIDADVAIDTEAYISLAKQELFLE